MPRPNRRAFLKLDLAAGARLALWRWLRARPGRAPATMAAAMQPAACEGEPGTAVATAVPTVVGAECPPARLWLPVVARS